MSFGSPTPLEIAVRGGNLKENRDYLSKVEKALKQIPELRDVQVSQSLDYPTVDIKVDREKAGQSGATMNQVTRSVVAATSSALERVAREIVESHAQVQARRKQITTAQRGIEAAQASYERNLARIENTQGLPLEALQSIQALTQARRDYLRAVSDFNASSSSCITSVAMGPSLESTPQLLPRETAAASARTSRLTFTCYDGGVAVVNRNGSPAGWRTQ
jgi:multidrug efflux pump subunit AcrB